MIQKIGRQEIPDLILQKIQATVYDGAIILFHDIYPETIRAVPQVIDYLKEQGYRITTVGDLLGHPTAVENYYGRNDHRPRSVSETSIF